MTAFDRLVIISNKKLNKKLKNANLEKSHDVEEIETQAATFNGSVWEVVKY